MLLLSILMISCQIRADDLPAVNDLDEGPPLANLQKTDGGFYISDENIIELANYIQDLQEEKQRLQILADVLSQSLEEEREKVQELIAGKDEIIKLQEEQIEDYKDIYKVRSPGIIEKASWAAGGAGIAAVLFLLAGMVN